MGAYIVSIVTYITLLKTYKHILALRTQYRGSAKPKSEQFTVLVRDIPTPRNGSLQDKVDNFFKKIYPDTYEKCLIVKKVKQVWHRNPPQHHLSVFLGAFAHPVHSSSSYYYYCRTNVSLTHAHPAAFFLCFPPFHQPEKTFAELEALKAKLERAEVVYANSKTKENPEGVRPQHKTGKFGLYGQKVDSIDTYNEDIKKLGPKLEEERGSAQLLEQGAAFIFFNSRRSAAAAGQCVHEPRANTWQTQPAPEPREVVWTNLSVTFYSRTIREMAVYGIVFLTVVFYMIPIGFVSAFTTLENLQKILPFVKSIVKIGALKSILEAYLPQIALIVFLALLPKFLLFLSKLEGIVAKSHLERAAAGKYFYFIVFNVFLGVTIGGSLFASGKAIAKDPGSIVTLLASALPPNATFFITFVALK